MRFIKRIVIALVVVCLAFVTFNSVKVNAATLSTSNLIKIEGAQVRTEGEHQGIRFVGNIGTYDCTNVTKYGVAIAFGEVNVSNEFHKDATINGKSVLIAETSAVDVNGNFYAVLYNIPEHRYVQNVTARAYVIDNGTYVYADSVSVRSLAEVTLKALNAGEDAELLTAVKDYVGANYKKVYTDKLGIYYVDSAIYESNPYNLGLEFVNDWNRKFNDTITTNIYSSTFSDTSNSNVNALRYALQGVSLSDDFSTNEKLYKFFTEDTDMSAKWSWLLEYIRTEVSTNGAMLSQIQVILGEKPTLGAATWYRALNTISPIGGFFRQDSYSTGINASSYDTHPELFVKTLNYNSSVYANLSNVTLVEVADTINLPNLAPIAGYDSAWYLGNVTEYSGGSSFVVPNTNSVFIRKNDPIEYTITYFDGETEIIDLAVTDYTIETDTITLPEYSKSGYAFDGWFDNEEFNGTPVVNIAKGTTGNKVFYAKTTASSNAEVNVSFALDGGYLPNGYQSSGGTRTIDFKTYDNTGGASNIYFCDTSVTKHNSLRWQYKILLSYNANLDLYEVVGADAATKRVNEVGVEWTHAIASASINVVSYANVGQFLAFNNPVAVGDTDFSGTIYNANAFQSYSTVLILNQALPTPFKAGYTFNGWESSIDHTIYTEYPGYAINPGDITYTAKWTAK